MLGYKGGGELLQQAFNEVDDDRSGAVHFDEIRAWLSQTATQKVRAVCLLWG